MGTHSSSAQCPNCPEQMDITLETRPYERMYGECLHCGFQFWPHESYMTLHELNEVRADADLPPVDSQPPAQYLV